MVEKMFPEVVEIIKLEVPQILRQLKWPDFITRAVLEDTLNAKMISMPKHRQYFCKVITETILANGYEPWSNSTGSRKYRSFRRIGAEEARSPCEGQVAGSTPASGLGETDHA